MIGMIRTIRFSELGLLIAVLVVVRSEAHGSNDRSDRLAYGSASVSENAFASAGSVASSSAIAGNGNLPGFSGGHDGHKGIRSYVESGYAGNDRENGGVKGRSGNGCPKCKWEDDDYWEKEEEEEEDEEEEEEEEEEGSDTECDDEDDGRYREHDHGHGHGTKGASSTGVQKLGFATPVGPVGNAPASVGTPIKAGIPPWNKVSPVSIGTAYHPDRSTDRQPGPGWNSPDTGSTPIRKPSWNSKPVVGSRSFDSWNAAPPNMPAAAAPNRFGTSWNKGRETGSGCSGGHRSGTGCAQGSTDAAPAKQGLVPFAGNVRKQGSPDYFPNPTGGHDPAEGTAACPGATYGNCGGNPAGRTKFAGPSTEPNAGGGQYPGSRSPQYNPVGQLPSSERGASSGPRTRNPLASGSLRSPLYSTTNPSPSNPVTGGPTAGPFPGGAPPSENSSPSNGNGPYESVTEPGYTGVKGLPTVGDRPTPSTYAGKPVYGDRKPGAGSATGYPASSGSARGLPANGHPSAASSPDRGASNKGDSKIFYINVSPAPGSPVGVKPHGTRTTNASYQPQTGSGTGTSKPSYRPSASGGRDATNPFYQPGPYSGTGTGKPSYRPVGIPGGRNASESPYRPDPPSGNGGWPDSATNNAHTSTTGETGSGCGGGTNRDGSPDYEPCDRNGFPGGVDESTGPLGGPDAYPKDFSQSSRPVIPGDNDRPSSGGPPAGSVCAGSTGCTPGAASPTYVDKTRNANALPGGGGDGGASYQWNPFLTGKLPSPDVGGPRQTTTDKPIGRGNPFLEGPRQSGNVAAGVVADAGAWSQAGASIDKEPIGKGNPFLGGSGHGRGDIEIDGSTGASRGGRPEGPWPSDRYPGSSRDADPAGHGSYSAVKNPPATNRGSGNGGGVGFGYDGHGNFADQPGHRDGDSSSGGGRFPGAFGSSQASSYASSNSGSHPGSADSTAAALGQGNGGSWPSNGASAGSRADSGYWSSSGASAYASSSASGWAGTGPISVKG